MKNVIGLTADQVNQVHARAARVDPALRRRFLSAYSSWKTTWNDPIVSMSSAPVARGQSAEFRVLLDLGRDSLPLLMEKLTEPDEFFALMAVDRLLPPEMVVRYAIEALLTGEQGRAIETVQRWLVAM
jgi:hypothetical protein